MNEKKEELLIKFFDMCYEEGLSIADMMSYGEFFTSYVVEYMDKKLKRT